MGVILRVTEGEISIFFIQCRSVPVQKYQGAENAWNTFGDRQRP